MSDAWILKHIGMDKDELLRLKQITGLAALFVDKEFSQVSKSNMPTCEEFEEIGVVHTILCPLLTASLIASVIRQSSVSNAHRSRRYSVVSCDLNHSGQ